MKPLKLAQQYMEIFFTGKNPEELSQIFSDDFSFSGPFYQFDSAKDYINSLKTGPPEDCEYKIIQSYEDDISACLIYDFSKPGVNTPMAQIFEINNGKISKILLVFDTGEFS
jgi:hypothetical protein